MDKHKQLPEMEGFFVSDPNADEHTRPILLADIVTALEETTKVLDDVIGYGDNLEQVQGLAIASRIFAGMLADRYTGERAVRKRSFRTVAVNVRSVETDRE